MKPRRRVRGSRPTLRNVAPDYFRSRPLRESTRHDQETTVAGLFVPALPAPLDAITTDDVEALFEALKRRGNSPSTLRKHLSLLRSFFGWALLKGYLEGDPTRTIRLPRIPRRRVGKALERDQVRELLEALEGRRRPFLAVAIAVLTGLRKGNILDLKWSDLELEPGREKLFLTAERMKGNADLDVPIARELAERLRLERAARDDPVILGAVVGGRSWRTSFDSAVVRAGLEPLRFHDLRHTFASWLEPIATEAQRKALLGHAIADPTDLYTHLSHDRLREAVDRLPSVLRAEDPLRGVARG